jgi:hypothetical protein
MNNLSEPQRLLARELPVQNPRCNQNKPGFSIFLGYVPMADTPA